MCWERLRLLYRHRFVIVANRKSSLFAQRFSTTIHILNFRFCQATQNISFCLSNRMKYNGQNMDTWRIKTASTKREYDKRNPSSFWKPTDGQSFKYNIISRYFLSKKSKIFEKLYIYIIIYGLLFYGLFLFVKCTYFLIVFLFVPITSHGQY